MATAVKKKKTAVAKRKTKTVSKTKTKTSTSAMKKGSKYQCGVCGVAVRVDEVCGCVDTCDIVCCGEQMEPKK